MTALSSSLGQRISGRTEIKLQNIGQKKAFYGKINWFKNPMRFGSRSFNVSKHFRCYIKVPRDKLNDHAENLETLKNMIPACFSSSIT